MEMGGNGLLSVTAHHGRIPSRGKRENNMVGGNRNDIHEAWHTDAVTRLVKEIRDRDRLGEFTLTAAEAHKRVLDAFEEEIYARELEKLRNLENATK